MTTSSATLPINGGIHRSSSSSNREAFPTLQASWESDRDSLALEDADLDGHATARRPSPLQGNGSALDERWQPRRSGHVTWENGSGHITATRPPRRSISEAWRNVRRRQGSVSANAHELAEALKAPVSVKLVTLCVAWYASSALTNTISKSILNAFPEPVTLTLIQFAFVSGWCVFLAGVGWMFPRLRARVPVLKNGLRYPSRDVLTTTLPLAVFQVFGHVLSSFATERIPVSLVHTIKGLSPLFTVLAYRYVYQIRYSTEIYLSLVPLTVGVVLACSVQLSDSLAGIVCALGAALIFVTQNIFSKKLFNRAARVEAEGPHAPSSQRDLDKLNLLCYSSGLALIFTLPMWVLMDAPPLYSAPLSLTRQKLRKVESTESAWLALQFFLNGACHFAQNFLAFILLSVVSPVTYSVASLIKRVFVIVFAIIWFGNFPKPVQGFGILLTFFGLYLYDRASDSDKADKRAKLEDARIQQPLLPMSTNDLGRYSVPNAIPDYFGNSNVFTASTNGSALHHETNSETFSPGQKY